MYSKLGIGLTYYPNCTNPIGIMARVSTRTAKKKMISKVFYFHHFDAKETWAKDTPIPEPLILKTKEEAECYRLLVLEQEWKGVNRHYRGATVTGEPVRKGRTMPIGKGNRTGLVGINHIIKEYPLVAGGVSLRKGWTATWTEVGRTKQKWFGYGGKRSTYKTCEEAKAKAIEYRQLMVKKHYRPAALL